MSTELFDCILDYENLSRPISRFLHSMFSILFQLGCDWHDRIEDACYGHLPLEDIIQCRKPRLLPSVRAAWSDAVEAKNQKTVRVQAKKQCLHDEAKLPWPLPDLVMGYAPETIRYREFYFDQQWRCEEVEARAPWT